MWGWSGGQGRWRAGTGTGARGNVRGKPGNGTGRETVGAKSTAQGEEGKVVSGGIRALTVRSTIGKGRGRADDKRRPQSKALATGSRGDCSPKALEPLDN